MRCFLFFFLAVVSVFSLQAQKSGYRFDHTTYDFGEVQFWNNQPATFSITNTGQQKILFLPTFPKDDLFVELPEGAIQPGETAIISIYYFTEGTGEFKRKISLYTNTANEAIELTIKGNILSLDPQAFIQCPGFAPKQQDDKTFIQEIIVLDKTTREPVDEATVWLSNQGNELKIYSNDKGTAKENILIGLYNIMVEKDGFTSTGESVYLNKQTGKIIIELEPDIVPGLITKLEDEKEEQSEDQHQEEQEDEHVFEDDEPEITFETYERVEYEERIQTSSATLPTEEDVVVAHNHDLPETLANEAIEEDIEEAIEEDLVEAIEEVNENELEEAITDHIEEEAEVSIDHIEEAAAITSYESAPLTEPVITPVIEEVLPPTQYNPNNIVFLVDVSSSMRKPEKLPLLKASMKRLTEVLRNIDKISLITYSSSADVVLSSTTADNKQDILALIDSLKAEGWTHGVKGIETAYEMLEANFIAGGNNQIILATDGVFNNPSYSERDLFSLVRDKSSEGIILSIIGFGDDSDAIRLMKKLANRGNGSFLQIENRFMANNMLIDEIKLHSLKTY